MVLLLQALANMINRNLPYFVYYLEKMKWCEGLSLIYLFIVIILIICKQLNLCKILKVYINIKNIIK